MKRLYTLFAFVALACGVMGAQNLQFIIGGPNGTPIAPGETVVNNNISVQDYGQDGKDVVLDPQLYIKSDATTKVTIRAVCTTGQMVMMCAGGDCVGGTDIEKPNVQLTANTPLNLEFEYKKSFYTPDGEVDKNITTHFSAFPVLNPQAVTEFILIQNSDDAKVTLLQTDKGIRYANGRIEYKSDAPGIFQLFDSEGREMIHKFVSGNGYVSVDNLKTGIYLYKIADRSGKIYIP